ncbi:beta-ketoacyl-ACP synthase II [Porphyromonas cangingivalis]|uniref:3-oxoacyl-[acyl-carrier-protein] synthase 2 n=1 Tax=Porphyromonas cangingivalis TaxID=36874 RepID=A0A1T4JR83_PORCN|nr:beta-ketoacyl-ACP synthase II [Porphyromonas cangingivalis]SJZ32679.1 3-oxoacyl-[acyl-carrier-protein] synthase II [Porphyromonas cangingivalis]VEJ04653.1 3-oxoacyl-[acyl-carrier-protein] synthase 2 [Porphyromonas cangingivalis]
MELKRVVVTGLGTISPLGNNVEDTWKALLEGKSGAGPVTLVDASTFKTQFACEVKDFDPNAHFDRKQARTYDRYSMFGLVAAEEAVNDAGLDPEKLDCNRVGVVFGAGIGGLKTFEEETMAYDPERGPRFSPFFIPKMIADIAAGHISMKYGFRGPNYATVSACASGTNAIADGFNLIRLGKANIIIAGGAEAAITISGLGGFNAMNALSTRNDDPQGASRPFSASRDGFVMGEGGAALILEEYEHAKARGAKIYAELAGAGMSADAHHLTASHPEGLGAKLVMRNALEDAEMTPEQIDYINVHGTSTPVGDISEVKAIQAVFGDHAYNLNISSTKSMTGHLLGAAGAIEALITVLAVKNDVVPPTINHADDDQDPEIDYKLNFTFNKKQERPVNAAISNTFGFGGHNASVIFKKVKE